MFAKILRMKLIIVAAISEDGFLSAANNPDPRSWTSVEDKRFFGELMQKHRLQVMGATTYDIMQPKPSANILRIVLTHEPEKYADRTVSGQLEFYEQTPQEFVDKYSKTYESCLVMGGAVVNESFLEEGLVDEIYLTIEPIKIEEGTKLFASGNSLEQLVDDLPTPIITRLNDQGTILKHFILK